MFTVEGWSGEKTIVCGEGPVDIHRLWVGVGNYFGWGPGGSHGSQGNGVGFSRHQ